MFNKLPLSTTREKRMRRKFITLIIILSFCLQTTGVGYLTPIIQLRNNTLRPAAKASAAGDLEEALEGRTLKGGSVVSHKEMFERARVNHTAMRDMPEGYYNKLEAKLRNLHQAASNAPARPLERIKQEVVHLLNRATSTPGLQIHISRDFGALTLRDVQDDGVEVYWIDEGLLNIEGNLLDLTPEDENYIIFDILYAELSHKLRHTGEGLNREAANLPRRIAPAATSAEISFYRERLKTLITETSVAEPVVEGFLIHIKDRNVPYHVGLVYIEEVWATLESLECLMRAAPFKRRTMLAWLEKWSQRYNSSSNKVACAELLGLAEELEGDRNKWTKYSGFTHEGIDTVGKAVIPLFGEFGALTTLSTRMPLRRVVAEREEKVAEVRYGGVQRVGFINLVHDLTGQTPANIANYMETPAGSVLTRENIQHIYGSFVEDGLVIVDRRGILRELPLGNVFRLLNVLHLIAHQAEASCIILDERLAEEEFRDRLQQGIQDTIIREGTDKATHSHDISPDSATHRFVHSIASFQRQAVVNGGIVLSYGNTTAPVIPAGKRGGRPEVDDKGGLTEDNLAVLDARVNDVQREVCDSFKFGALSWAHRVYSIQGTYRPNSERLLNSWQSHRDIIVLGAPSLAEAYYRTLGSNIDSRRVHFISSNIEGERLRELEKELGIDWDQTCVVVVDRGDGSSIERENLAYLRTKVTDKDRVAVIAPRESITFNEASEANRFLIPSLEQTDGMPIADIDLIIPIALFRGVAEAMRLTLDTSSIINEYMKEAEQGTTPLSATTAGKLAGILLALSERSVEKDPTVGPVPINASYFSIYEAEARPILDALTEFFNTLLGSRITGVSVRAPEHCHCSHANAGLGGLGLSVVLFNRTHTGAEDADPDNRIPSSAKNFVRSIPAEGDHPAQDFTFTQYIEAARKANADISLTPMGIPNMSVTYNGYAELIALMQLASIIAYHAALKAKDPKVADAQARVEAARRFDSLFEQARSQPPQTDGENPISYADGRASIRFAGLIDTEGGIGEANLGAVLAEALEARADFLYEVVNKGTHVYLGSPGIAAGAEFQEGLRTARDIGSRGGEDYFFFGIGGARNTMEHGIEVMRFSGNENNNVPRRHYMSAYELRVVKERILEVVRNNPRGLRAVYTSNSGVTDEPDMQYRKMLEALIEVTKEMESKGELDEAEAIQRLRDDIKELREYIKTPLLKRIFKRGK